MGKTTTRRQSGRIILDVTTQAFLGSAETLPKREFDRLDWFGPAALIYTWLRQSMEKWTSHPLPPLPLSPLPPRVTPGLETPRFEAPLATALRDLAGVPGCLYLLTLALVHLSCVTHTLSDLGLVGS